MNEKDSKLPKINNDKEKGKDIKETNMNESQKIKKKKKKILKK